MKPTLGGLDPFIDSVRDPRINGVSVDVFYCTGVVSVYSGQDKHYRGTECDEKRGTKVDTHLI